MGYCTLKQKATRKIQKLGKVFERPHTAKIAAP